MDSKFRINKEINAHSMNDVLPGICKLIDLYEVNVTKMCKETNIPRSTLYEFLYSDSNALNMIQKLIVYLGVEISIKPAARK